MSELVRNSAESWQRLAGIRQGIIQKQARQITALQKELSQVQQDYDTVEGELKALVLSAKAARPKTQAKVTVLR